MSIALRSTSAARTDRADSVEQLYRDHHGWLRALLQRKLGDVQHAADLAHDAFVTLLRSRPAAAAPQALREPRAYLRTVAHGLVVDHIRRQTLERAYLEALARQPAAQACSEEERLIVLQALQRVDALLAALPVRAREVFLLSQLEGLDYAQIAERLGVSLRTVKRDMQAGFAQCIAAML